MQTLLNIVNAVAVALIAVPLFLIVLAWLMQAVEELIGIV
jgi:hypothetical protein